MLILSRGNARRTDALQRARNSLGAAGASRSLQMLKFAGSARMRCILHFTSGAATRPAQKFLHNLPARVRQRATAATTFATMEIKVEVEEEVGKEEEARFVGL